MWRMRVVHATGYAYKSPVTASFNEARLTPRSDSRQNVILNRVETVPATRSYRYVDYWGTAVTAFDLHAPHTELEVTASSVVETDKAEHARGDRSPGTDLQSAAVIDRFDEVLDPDGVHAGEQAHRAGRASGSPSTTNRRRPSIEAANVGARRARLRARHHRRALLGSGRAARRQGRLPGLRAPDADPVAQHGNSGPLRVGLSAPQAQGGGRRHHRRPEPRLDPGVDRRLVELRPHQRQGRSTSSTSASASAATTPT